MIELDKLSRTFQFGLKGRWVLITGAGGHIGVCLARKLAFLGANLILLDSDVARVDALKLELEVEYSTKNLSIACDLESASQRSTITSQIADSGLDSLTALVNNAAFGAGMSLDGWMVPFERQSLETWTRVMEVNVAACFHLCQILHPFLVKSNHASILNVGSIYGVSGPDWSLYQDLDGVGNPAAYAASKGGLVQLTRWLACTLAPEIRVNAVSPGGVFRSQDPRFVKRYISRTPLERMATEADVANAIIFLISDLSSYITGQNILVDGGWSL